MSKTSFDYMHRYSYNMKMLPTLQNGNMKIIDNGNTMVYCFSIAPQPLVHILRNKGINVEGIDINTFNVCLNCKACIDSCYDKKSYRNPSVTVSRVSNLLWTMSPDFIDTMIRILTKLYNKAIVKYGKKLVIRWHVAGDFYSVEYLLKTIEIIKALPDVTFYTYTKHYNMIESHKHLIPTNMNILYSLFDGSSDEDINTIVNATNNVFYATDTKDLLSLFNNVIVTNCNGFDCMNCHKCEKMTRKRLVITTPIH